MPLTALAGGQPLPMRVQPELDPASGLPRHINALDGLRGVAILLVLLHHFLLYRPTQSLPGQLLNGFVGFGWSGVDLFFVLSGFLITGILFDSKEKARYFRNFYARRTLRIFPLYYGMLFLCTFIVPRIGILKDGAPDGSSWWWWVYVSNFRYAFHPERSMGWIGIFWSLAVEEHFYLVWPGVIYFCTRRQAMIVSIACVGLASIARGLFILHGNSFAPYVLTPCRMDSLAAGALIALTARGPGGIGSLQRPSAWIGILAAPCALAVVIWRHSIVWDPWVQMVGFPLITCSFACLLAISANPFGPKRWRAVLESRSLRAIGKYSYGMYVFHFAVEGIITHAPGYPFYVFPPQFDRLNELFQFLILSAATFAVAFVSWHLYESRFLRLKRYFGD